MADKLDQGLSKPILPEVFVPYTVAMGMFTQMLVRSEVPPLTLLHSVRAAVNSIDPDQQTNADVRDLEHWISRTPEWARGQLVAWLFGAFAALALALCSRTTTLPRIAELTPLLLNASSRSFAANSSAAFFSAETATPDSPTGIDATAVHSRGAGTTCKSAHEGAADCA